MWVGCIQLHPEHRQKPLLLRSQISQFQGGRNSSKIRKSKVSNSCFQTSFSQRGGLFKNLLSKHLNQNKHISKSPVLTSLTSSCLWSSDVPWESWLVFLDRHASIGQAKGTVNLPRKQARLSKLLLLRRQSVLCLHFPLMLQHYSWKYGQPFSSVPSDPSRPLSSRIACASFIVLPRSPVLDTICMLTLPWKRGSFFLFFFLFFLWGSLAGGSPWMADLVPLVPHSSHRSLKLWWISSVTFSRKKTAIISIECSSFLSRCHVQHNFSARCFNGFPDCKMTLWMPLISSSEWQKKREDFTQKRRKKMLIFTN